MHHLKDRLKDKLSQPSFLSNSLVHGKVPVLPEFLQVGRVPPVVIEVSVSEAEELPDGVEEGVEVDVEEAEPDDVVGQGQF